MSTKSFPGPALWASASNRLRAPQFKIGALDLSFSIDAPPRPEDQPRLKASATDLDVVITQLRYDCHILPTIRCSDCEVWDVAIDQNASKAQNWTSALGAMGRFRLDSIFYTAAICLFHAGRLIARPRPPGPRPFA